MTGDRRYIDLGLGWAEGFRIAQPQHSWLHSFYAKYATDEKKRVEAAAYAQYLDPDSAWLASVPDKVKQAATIWWQKNNPFDPSKMMDQALTSS